MGKNTVPSIERLARIHARQGERKWHSNYEAAIRANREEAPAHSRPSAVNAPRFGRRLQALSIPEAKAFRIAHYLPQVVEALDQYVLPTTPVPNFLTGSPFDPEEPLPHYRGTVAVAESLGVLKYHPVVRNGEQLLPFPFVGDLLVFFRTPSRVEMVNISIKSDPADFDRPYAAGRQSVDPREALKRVRARHSIEEVLHLEAGVRTVRFTPQDCTDAFHRNLEWFHGWAHRQIEVPDGAAESLGDALDDAQEKCEPPLAAVLALARKFGLPEQDGKTLLARAVLNRRVKIEIESGAFLLDQPLQKEARNPQDAFRGWFGADQ